MFGVLDLAGNHLGASAVALVSAVYAAYKYHRLKAWGTLIVGGISTVTFTAGTLFVGGLLAVGAGWIDPGVVFSDLVTWGSDAWDVVAGPLIDLITGVLDE